MHRDGDLHARTDEHAVVDGTTQTGVGAPRVAYRRDTELERRHQVRGRLIEAVAERPVLDRQLVVLVRAGQVHVGVEQPREQRLARAVDALVAIETRPDVDDPAVLDHDVAVGERRHRAVEHLAPVEQRLHRSTFPSSTTNTPSFHT
jgi:hypothetical protein